MIFFFKVKKLTNSIVHGLENRRTHPATLGTQRDNLGHLKRRVVAQTQLYKLALLVQLIDFLQSLRKRHRPVRRMQIKNIHLVSAQFLERQLEIAAQVLRLVFTRLCWICLGGQLQAALLPPSLARECFLLAVNVDARGVDFVVALRLQVVQLLVEVVQRCDARAFAGIWAIGHQPKDDPGLTGGCYKRHCKDFSENTWRGREGWMKSR